jgi:hypothetical protein
MSSEVHGQSLNIIEFHGKSMKFDRRFMEIIEINVHSWNIMEIQINP